MRCIKASASTQRLDHPRDLLCVPRYAADHPLNRENSAALVTNRRKLNTSIIPKDVRWAKGNRAAAEIAKRDSSFSITYSP